MAGCHEDEGLALDWVSDSCDVINAPKLQGKIAEYVGGEPSERGALEK